jgi:hypothetical protein
MTATKPAEQHKRKGLGTFLTNNRRAVIVLGALIALASYFAKDVFSERTKEKAAAISSGASAYLASMPELRGQLNEIFNAGQILNADPASVPRDSVLGFIGSLTLRAQTNTLQLVEATEKGSHSRRSWSGPVIHQSPLARMQYEL